MRKGQEKIDERKTEAKEKEKYSVKKRWKTKKNRKKKVYCAYQLINHFDNSNDGCGSDSKSEMSWYIKVSRTDES
jgi:hypothetical protein